MPAIDKTAEAQTPLTTAQTIKWWELRRLLYNAVLLVIGMSAIAGMEWLMDKVLPLGEDAIEPMALFLGVATYGVLANLCYTLGWVVELWLARRDPDNARERGVQMFRAGMAFSCLLTSLPFWLACLYWAKHRGHST